jgi:hypothetical protein
MQMDVWYDLAILEMSDPSARANERLKDAGASSELARRAPADDAEERHRGSDDCPQ